MKKSRKRLLVVITAMVMAFGMTQASVFAANGSGEDEETAQVSEETEAVTDETEETVDAENTEEEASEDNAVKTLDADEVTEADETDETQDADEPKTLAYTGDGSGNVVINLGNGNGSYNFGDYAGNKSAGTELRYTVEAAEYADEDGSLTINLPSDNDLDSGFTVIDESGGLDAATVDLGKEQAYDYKLIGWVNIATGDYYSVKNGSTTADIDLDDENVFYADWIAADYDHGSSSDEGLIDTVSTGDFVTLHMFDYNELFNMYSSSPVQNGTDSETWSDGGTLYEDLSAKGGEVTNSFLFNNDAVSATGAIGYLQSRTSWNTWTNSPSAGKTGYVLDAADTWGIGDLDNAPMLDKLFDTSASGEGVYYVGDGDYLFYKDEDGYYTYDSEVNSASYNQSEGRFYVYDDPQVLANRDYTCFLPYNGHGDTLSTNDGSVDYWFGMNMNVTFYLPNSTGSGGNTVNGKDMVFNFSGDDDIMIYVDNELALDMSGIHDRAFGSINFNTGEVQVSMERDADGNLDPDYMQEDYTLDDISSGNHTLSVYYLERGGYESNLEIQFNVVPLWDYETGDVQTITAEKTWKDADGNEITDSSELQKLLSEDSPSIEVGLFDTLKEATDDDFGYTKDGSEYTVEYTDDNGAEHKYVYDSSGPSLTYTKDGDAVVDADTDSDGKVEDDDGYLVAWLDGDELHIRMDQQTLNADNKWKYSWEMLDSEGDYEVLELTESSSYTTTLKGSDLTKYSYWSVIGDAELEAGLGGSDLEEIILTDAAEQTTTRLGNTKEANGWVIVASTDGISGSTAKFSQIATLETIKEDDGSVRYKGTYGVTSKSEIDALGEGAIWYVKDAEEKQEDVDGNEVEAFYLYCSLDGTQYWLTTDSSGSALALSTSESDAGEFYYDALGELRISDDDTHTDFERVIINSDGTVEIGEPETAAATNDVRLYTYTEAPTSGTAFAITNTFGGSDKTRSRNGGGTTGTTGTPGNIGNTGTNGTIGTQDSLDQAVDTGDTNTPVLWLILMICAVVAAGITVGTRKNRSVPDK